MKSRPDTMAPLAAAEALIALRRAPTKDDLELNAEGQALLDSLEAGLRPNELAASFPRIVNQMARLWRRPREMDKYFDGLLVDTRGNRHGFSLKVLIELTTLKEHYQTTAFPAGGSIWDGADSVRGKHQ
jgi:hypothetical protein